MVKRSWLQHNSLQNLKESMINRMGEDYRQVWGLQPRTFECGRHEMETNARLPRVSVTEILEKCLGCKWTMHVLTQIRAGVNRPGQLQRTAEGLSTKVLNERLAKLVALQIVEREAFPEIPPRVEYRLTPFGEQFVKIFDQIDELQRRFEGAEESLGSSGGLLD